MNLETIELKVAKYAKDSVFIPNEILEDEEVLNYIVKNGAEIMILKWELNIPVSNSFATVFAKNDLIMTLAAANENEIKCLKFYYYLFYTLGMYE